jgi:hypothetical protein
MSSSDQDKNGSSLSSLEDTSVTSTQRGIESDVLSTFTETPQKSWFTWKIWTLCVLAMLALLYTSIDSKDPNVPSEADIALVDAFDLRLLSCNEVTTSTPSDAYDTCLSVAEEGDIEAIKRIIWAYSRQSDYQDLGEVFKWLRALPYKDNATQLLMFSLVHINTKSDKLRKDSELGISKLVAMNYAPANVVLASIYALDENIVAPTSNTLWLLNRAYKKDPLIIEPSLLALIHANGLVSNVDIDAGAKLLKQSADKNFPGSTNNIAWFLSTLDSNPFAPSDYAISLAQRVVDDPVHGKNPIYVDTLAATFAANNMFDKAVETQNLALELLISSNFSEAFKQQTKEEFEQRIALYSQNEALVEETLAVDKIKFFRKLRNMALESVLRGFFIIIEKPVLPGSEMADDSATET